MQTGKAERSPRAMAFSRLKAAPNSGWKRFAMVVRHEHGDGLMQHFRNGVSEDSFGGFIDEKNSALTFDGDDGFGSRFGDDSEQLGGLDEPFTGAD